jgi:hypothetical protein
MEGTECVWKLECRRGQDTQFHTTVHFDMHPVPHFYILVIPLRDF